MQVQLSTCCTTSEETASFNVTIDSDKSIWDLKKEMEGRISVGACDQIMSYRGRVLENAKTLTSLYIKDGDCFNVEYAATCDIRPLKTVLSAMEAFVTTVCEEFDNNIIENMLSSDSAYSEVAMCYENVFEALESCSNSLFMPWHSDTAVASRHFFRQEGGLDMLSIIYKFTRKKFQAMTVEDEEDLISTFNDKQQVLEYMCLVALWNYSEIKADRQMVLEKIGLDMFIESLVRSEPSCRELFEGDVYPHINEAAVGCLAQYVEMPDIQLRFAANLEAVTKLVSISSFATTLYHQEVAANTLFCTSNNPKAVAHLVTNEIHHLVVEKMQPILTEHYKTENFSVAIQYFFCLFLANIRALAEKNVLSEQEKCDIDTVLETFVTLYSPSEIGDYERRHSYVWITLAPFVQLALSKTDARHSLMAEPNEGTGSTVPEQKQYTFSSAAKIGLFSLCHLAKRNPNQDLFKKEKLLDFLVCIRWFAMNCEELFCLVPDLTELPNVEPPRLEAIAKAYLAKCYGYRVI